MHNIYAYTEGAIISRKELVATASTLEEAVEYVNENLDPYVIEVDEDYPTCADCLLNDGRVVTIEPENFRLAA